MPKPLKKQLVDMITDLSRFGPDKSSNEKLHQDLLSKAHTLFTLYEKRSRKNIIGELPMLKDADRDTFQKQYEDFLSAANQYYMELDKNPAENAERMNVILSTQQAVLTDSRRLAQTQSLEWKTFSDVFPRDAVGELREDNSELARFETTMNAVNKGAFIGSSQFDAVMTSFKKVKQLSAAEAENPGYASEALKEAYTELHGKLTTYLKKKEDEEKALARKGKQPSAVAKNRTDFARRLQAFVTERCNDPDLFDELPNAMISKPDQPKTDKELGYEFMNSVYAPVPIPNQAALASGRHPYYIEDFNQIPHLDIKNFKLGGKPLSSEDFSVLAIGTMLMPGYSEQAKLETLGAFSPEVRGMDTITMFCADAANFRDGVFIGREDCFRSEYIHHGIIPARQATYEALQKYQEGNLDSLANILAAGLISYETYMRTMAVGTNNMYAFNKAFDHLRSVMERDPALKEATFARYRQITEEAAEKLPALKQQVEEAQTKLTGIQKKKSPEFVEAAKQYVKVHADQVYYEGKSKMKPENSLRALNSYVQAEKIALRCTKARMRLREAQRTGRELSPQDKRRCVTEILLEGALNASTNVHKVNEDAKAERLTTAPGVLATLMNEETASLASSILLVDGRMQRSASPLIFSLSTKQGPQAFDAYFKTYVTEGLINKLVKTDNAALLGMDTTKRASLVEDSMKEVARAAKANTNNAPNNSRTQQNVKSSDQPSRGRG